MPPAAERPSFAPLAWACACFGGGIVLHVDRIPLWASATGLALIGWRLASARTGNWVPGITARALLALAAAALVVVKFHTLNGLGAGTTLLILMGALKLLETRGSRDQLVMVGAALFLLLAACLDRQNLARAPLYAALAWMCCAALAVIALPSCGARVALHLAGRSLLLAAPLALGLFLFFPRLPGAFWSVPRNEQAVTGLSDTMSPGSIGVLTTNYDAAFRVTFAGQLPLPEQRYFRGPVLHDFDGHTWRHGPALPREPPPLTYLGSAYRYRVTLEPTRQRWWFALDTPGGSPDALNVRLTYDSQLLADEPVTTAVTFEGVSYLRTRPARPLEAQERRAETALPEGLNPRSTELAHTLRGRAISDAGFVQATLAYLRDGGFEYSLTPERLGTNEIDELLFKTREGFCGHYASAFVTLMRAAGVPSRVVTGYLGGEWNPIGGYLLVHQSDAHAWAEVWLEGSGWTRVDPTAAVAPERLRYGLLDLLPDAFSARERLSHSSPWVADLLQRWDAANSWWRDRVVKFDYPAQLNLLARLGLHSPDGRTLGWAFMLALMVWLAIIAWHVGRGGRPAPPDTLARAYLRLCAKLARAGMPRQAHQGPLSFAASVAAERPELGATVQPLLARYAQLRYGAPDSGAYAAQIEQFRRAVARLSLPRRGVEA